LLMATILSITAMIDNVTRAELLAPFGTRP
jgi:hypothetical protein